MIPNIIRMQLTVTVLFAVFAFSIPAITFAQLKPDFTEKQSDTLFDKQMVQFLLKNPSSWIQNNINKLNTSSLIHPPSPDTVGIIEKPEK